MKSINLIQLKNKTPFKEAKFNKNKKKLKATIVILKRKINSTEREWKRMLKDEIWKKSLKKKQARVNLVNSG